MASKVDTSDPNVRRMVYNMYRGILGNYNQQANNIISSLPKERVVEDKGISRHVESMMRQSNQIAASNGSTPQIGTGPIHHGAPPPPPPPPVQGAAPVRITSEIGPSKKGYEPPAAIQNAMMTKDKKPFTYTPGGLDLAEIRSPRMARRISRNAHMEDSCSVPQPKCPATGPAQPLPPAAIAAMQPQLAIPVFPPGAEAPPSSCGFPPPPPPLPSVASADNLRPAPLGPPPPPPPPMPNMSSPTPLQIPATNQYNVNQQSQRPKNGNNSPPPFLQDIQNRPALRPVGGGQPKPLADFINEIPCHSPLKPVNHPPRSSFDPSSNIAPIQVQLKPVSPKSSTSSPQCSSPPFIPLPPPTFVPNQHVEQHDSSPQYSSNPSDSFQDQTFAQTMPVQQKRPLQQQPTVYIPPNQAPQSNPVTTPIRQTPPSPAALNKSPAPWLTNRQVQKQESQQPPWTVKQIISEDKATLPPPPPTHTRVIPIQIEGREQPPSNYQQQMAQQMQQMQIQMQQQMQQQIQQQQMQQQQRQIQQQLSQQQSVANQQAQYSPQIMKQINNVPKQEQGRTRIIPIQMEGDTTNDVNNQQKIASSLSAVGYGQNRFQNSPQAEGIQRTSSVDATDRSRQLQSQMSWTQGANNIPPTQSKSFRVLQKITGSEDQPSAPLNEGEMGETYLINRVLPIKQDRLDESEY